MATITKNSSGNWKAIIRKKGWPTTIKTFRTKADARDWARGVEDKMVRGTFVDRAPTERLTLNAAMARYLAEVSPTKSTGAKKKETSLAKALLRELGDYSLASITPELVAGYRDGRLTEGKSNNTVRLELQLLSHLYRVGMQEWQLGLIYNPVSAIRKPSPGSGRTRRLSQDEECRLLKACADCSNPMLGWIVRLALHTSMRAGEIKSLRVHYVNLDRRIAFLEHTKNGSVRTVPLTPGAVEVLKEAIANPARPMETDLIFPGEPGRDGKRRPYEFNPAWRQALKSANITDLRFHDLRHEAISRLVESGLGDQEVAAISGHKSMQMLKRYTHLRAEDLVEKLDRLFS